MWSKLVRWRCRGPRLFPKGASFRGAAEDASAASEFCALEHRNWERAVDAYDRGFGPLTRQCIPELLKSVSCKSGLRLLDVATGPGFAAQAAAEMGAEVTAVDFSKKMLDMAQERMAQANVSVRLIEADAAKLPFDDGSFNAVICAFGVLHLATPDDFFAEAVRVLQPGGCLAFTVWAEPPSTAAFDLILKAVKEHGNPNVPLPPGPPFFQFADHGNAHRSLAAAGLIDVRSYEVPQLWELLAADDLFVAFRDGTGRTAALLAGQTPSQLKAVETALLQGAESYKTASAEGPRLIRLPMPCVLTVARKPGEAARL